MNSLKLPPFSEYERLFQVTGILFFIDDIWADHYKTLEVVVVVRGNEFTSYLPKRIIQKTLEEGVRLFSSSSEFEVFVSDFKKYMEETDAFFHKHIESGALEKETAKEFLSLVSRLFYFYSKAEFFYTDKAYEQSLILNNPVLTENLKKWSEMKNIGRAFLNAVFFGSEAYLSKLLQKCSDVFGVSVNDLQQYSREEILNLWGGQKVSDEIITERNKGFVLQGDGHRVVSVIGDDAFKMISIFREEDAISLSKEFKGTIANKGYAKGKVKIITADYANFDSLFHLINSMDHGDVLVAETTSPELMPACSKASAILTDQGGLMSHAAIVSREMNIPCLVGFKNLTKALKDGDMVEVDAEKGIVTILN